jgi:spermidine synthase
MAPQGNRRATVAAETASGIVELRPDPAWSRAWTLLVNGVAQSYVDLADPEHLDFSYLTLIGVVLRRCAPAGVPLTVLHLGGGGLALPRLLDHLRPGSAQRVVERDADLAALVTRLLPPPPAIEIVIGDARERLTAEEPGRYDVIVSDVFEGARPPRSVTTTGYAEAARRALKPDGLLVVNVVDVPPLEHTATQVATLRAVFPEVRASASAGMLRGERAGNVILLAGTTIRPAVGPLITGPEWEDFAIGAMPLLDAPA